MRIELTKKFKNEIHEIIVANGLNPDLFQWEVTGSDFNTHTVEDPYGPLTTHEEPDTVNSLAIKIDDQPYFFTFDRQHTGKYCASMRPAIEKGDKVRVDTLPLFLTHFAQWLFIIKYELEEPDLWKTPFAQAFNNKADGDENRKFSAGEVARIKNALADIKRKLEVLPNFGTERMEKMDEVLTYIGDKAETETVFDWKNLSLGAIMSTYVAVFLTPFANDLRDAVIQYLAPVVNGFLSLR